MKYAILLIYFIAINLFGQIDQARTKSGSLNKLRKEENKLPSPDEFNLLDEANSFNIFDLDIAKKIPRITSNQNYNIAVVIGNKDYILENVPDVDYALNDAMLINQCLQDALGFKTENIIFLENATQAELNLTFGTSVNHKGKLFDYVIPGKSEIFIYYSGHGAPNTDDNSTFIVPVDCDPDKVALNGYSIETLYNNLDKLANEKNVLHVTVVLDACFSGNSQKGNLLSNISPIEIKIKNNTMMFPNKTIFTSTSNNQVSTWYEEKQMSLFTYFFIKGLTGEADIDGNNKISAAELYQFTIDETSGVPYWSRRLNGRTQIPKLLGKKEYEILVSED